MNNYTPTRRGIVSVLSVFMANPKRVVTSPIQDECLNRARPAGWGGLEWLAGICGPFDGPHGEQPDLTIGLNNAGL